MKRKIIKQGPATLMISLPSKWVKRFDIKRGDYINLDSKGNKLVITTDKPLGVKPKEFSLKGLDELNIKRYLYTIHKAGYDDVKLLFHDPKTIKQIHELIRGALLGFEIVDQGKTYCHVKTISTASEDEFDQILRRIFLVTMQFGENILECIESGDIEHIRDLLILEETNDKLTNFCERILNKHGYRDFSKTSFMYCLVWKLEKIADDFKNMGLFMLQNPDMKLNGEIKPLFSMTNELMRDFYNLFYNFSKDRLVKFSDNCTEKIEQSHQVLSLVKGKEDVVISYLTVIISKIENLRGPLIGLQV